MIGRRFNGSCGEEEVGYRSRCSEEDFTVGEVKKMKVTD